MKLKPCPFGCDTGSICTVQIEALNGVFYAKECSKCKATGPYGRSIIESEKAWNTRRKVRKQKSQKEQSI